MHCVKRCAVHWREVCRRRRLGRGLGTSRHAELYWTKSDRQDRGRPCDGRERSLEDWNKLIWYAPIRKWSCFKEAIDVDRRTALLHVQGNTDR